MVRVLVFGDLHDKTENVQRVIELLEEFKPELIFSLGDIVNYKSLMSSIASIKENAQFFCVHGNNDNLEDISSRCKEFSFMNYLHKSTINFGSWKIFGIGGVIGNKSRNMSHEELQRIGESCEDFDILLTHLDPESDGGEVFMNIIKNKKPSYWFHGHDHQCAGKICKVGKTTIVNASKPIILDIT